MGAWGGGTSSSGAVDLTGGAIGLGKRQRIGECRPAVAIVLRRKGDDSVGGMAESAAVANSGETADKPDHFNERKRPDYGPSPANETHPDGETEPGGLSMLAGYDSNDSDT